MHCLWLCDQARSVWQLHEVGDRLKELVQEFWNVHYKETLIHACQSLVRWSPPSAMCYKVNFDAAILEVQTELG